MKLDYKYQYSNVELHKDWKKLKETSEYKTGAQFKPGMTHDNHGHGSDKWQIDHIIPIHAFKGELEANLQVVYWFGNTQPLWTPENIAKGNKYTEEGKQALICRYQAWVTAGRPPPVH